MFTIEQTMQEAWSWSRKISSCLNFYCYFHIAIVAYHGVYEETVSTEVKVYSESERN